MISMKFQPQFTILLLAMTSCNGKPKLQSCNVPQIFVQTVCTGKIKPKHITVLYVCVWVSYMCMYGPSINNGTKEVVVGGDGAANG